MKYFVVLCVCCSLICSPLFGYTNGDIVNNTPLFSSLLDESEDVGKPLLFYSYDEERQKAGTGICLFLKVDESDPVDLLEETVPEAAAEVIEAMKNRIYVSAGPDIYIKTGTEIIIGTETILEEGILVAWTQVDGPYVLIEDPAAPQISFTPLREGVYVFMVKTEYPGEYVFCDTVTVVADTPFGNHVSCAYAGVDRCIELPAGGEPILVELIGTGFDADNDTLEFKWEQIEGPEISIFFQDTEKAEIHPVQPGVYVFKLTVSDGKAVGIPDTVSVVCHWVFNRPPVALADDIYEISDGQSMILMLDGSGSYDPDGDDLTYVWEQIEGIPISISNTTAEKPIVEVKQPGDYWFKLSVDDGINKSIPVEISLQVNESSELDTGEAGGGCSSGGNTGTGAEQLLLIIAFIFIMTGRRKWVRSIR